jgi:carbonic anhydrase/acetyltransferase-like protein (isoleucine patch superfamily)
MSSDGGETSRGTGGRTTAFPLAVRAHPSAFVAPGAVVVGEVTLGERASVWFGAVLRGDLAPIEIGDESNVQDNAVFHVDEDRPARVGRRVVVGHGAIVHGAEVEDGCLVGMGAVLLNGARIGAGSLVAAGALVAENKVIPPRSLVAGVPGKVTAPVSDEMRAAMDRGAGHYVELSRAYLALGLGAALPAGPGGSIFATMPVAPGELETSGLLAALAAAPAELAAYVAGIEAAFSPSAAADRVRGILAEWAAEEEAWAAQVARMQSPDGEAVPPVRLAAGAPIRDAAAAFQIARSRTLARLRLLPAQAWMPVPHEAGAARTSLGALVRRRVSADAARLCAIAAARLESGT